MYIFLRKMKNESELINNIDMPFIIKKIIIKYKVLFNIVNIKKIDDTHYLYIIPKCKEKKIEKIIRENSNKTVILSKELQKYKDRLAENKKILVYFVYNILEYLMKKTDRKIEEENLHILVNAYNEINVNTIKSLAEKVKTLTVVTDNVKRFSVLEEKMYDSKGILINITNNKKKALRSSEIIINLDFDNEQINKYRINRKAIIVNVTNHKLKIRFFEGIIINNIDINFKEKEEYNMLLKDFNKLDIYNSFEISKYKYIEILRKMVYNNITIKKLIGTNGRISEKELENYKKIKLIY